MKIQSNATNQIPALDGALVAASLTLAVVAIAMKEYGVAIGLLAVAAGNAVSVVRGIGQSASTSQLPTVITEETVRMLIARETAALRGLTGVQGFIDDNDDDQEEPERVPIVSKPRAVDVSEGYVVFKAKNVNSSTGSDLMDLEGELGSTDRTSGTILVLTEFRSRRAESATLVGQIERGARINEVICHGIFENVDVIPHLGTDAWRKRDEINAFLASVKGVYSRVVIWLPEEEYFAWTGVIDHFGNATTRLFNESVR
ncbi:MAG: hypothetical protein V4760_11250 [Bdellovibrionota bacterium]